MLAKKREALSDPWTTVPGTPDLTPQATGPAQFRHVGGMLFLRRFYRIRLLP